MENTPELFTATVVAISVAYALGTALLRYAVTKRPFRELPMAEGNHFLFGHLRVMFAGDFKVAFQKLFIDRANRYGQVGLWFLRFPVLGVSSVKDARAVLAVEHERRPPRLAKHFLRHFTGEKTLLVINGSAWKFHRSSVARTLNPKFLMASRPGMQEAVEVMVTSLQEEIRQSPVTTQEFNVEPLMKMITLDIFGKMALSTDFGLCKTLKPSPLVQAFEYLLSGTMTRLRAPFKLKNILFSIPCEQNRTHKRERTLIRSFIADLINQKRDQLKKGDMVDNDLLSHLIRAHRDVPGGKLKEEDVSDEAMTDVVMTLLFAGYGKLGGLGSRFKVLLFSLPHSFPQCHQTQQA